MNAENAVVGIGTELIYVAHYGAEPRLAMVVKISKTGSVVRVGGVDGEFRKTPLGDYYEVGRNANGRLHLQDEAKLVALKKTHAEREEAQAERRLEIEEKRRKREEAHAVEMADAIDCLGGDLVNAVAYREVMPDGARFLVLHVPVKEDRVAVLGPRVTVTVKLKVCSSPWDESGAVRTELAMTMAHKKSSSFSSFGTSTHVDDEAALWEAVRVARQEW